MSGHNPLEHVNTTFKRNIRRLAGEHLPPHMQADDAEISQSDAARVIRAMESHDVDTLAELRAAVLSRQPKPVAPVVEEETKQPMADKHTTGHYGEDMWFHINGPKLLQAALEAKSKRESQANPRDVISETIQMRREGLDVSGEGYGAHRRPPVTATSIKPENVAVRGDISR